jgi:hypothetical protein
VDVIVVAGAVVTVAALAVLHRRRART